MERDYRVRKLTPRECFRLMDVSEENIDKIQKAGISESQQYKMAGNSIVVSCLVEIFRQMFRPNYIVEAPLKLEAKPVKKAPEREDPRQLSLFDFVD